MALLGAVLALLLLGGCTGRKPTPTDYGETTRTNFLLGCIEEADRTGVEADDAYCKCSYTEIVKTIPYDEFKEINSELCPTTPAPLPPKMLKIRDKCIEETGDRAAALEAGASAGRRIGRRLLRRERRHPARELDGRLGPALAALPRQLVHQRDRTRVVVAGAGVDGARRDHPAR